MDDESADDAVTDLAREMLSCVPPESIDAPLQEYLALASVRLKSEGNGSG
jgi:hypothetical protein